MSFLTRYICFTGLIAIAAITIAPTHLNAAQGTTSSTRSAQDTGARWQINLKNGDIQDLVNQVAAITGRTFVVDPRVKGKVTVISSTSLDAEGVYDLFLSVLRVHGFAAVQTGDVTKIIQQTLAKQSADQAGTEPRLNEEIVTRVIRAENVASAEIVKILRPMIPQYGHIAAVVQPNVVIISDHAANITRLQEIIEHIDVADKDQLLVYPLKEAWVGEVAEVLSQVVPVRSGGRKQANEPNSVQIIANERNNSLILKGSPVVVAETLLLVKELDQPNDSDGATQVIFLRHSDATAVVEILNALVTGRSARGGTANAATGNGQAEVSIQADESLNAIVVRADPGAMTDIRDLIEKLDIRRTQVLIEAAIVEVSLDASDSQGVDLALIDRSGTVPAFSTGLSPSLGTILSSLAPGTDGTGATDPSSGLIGALGAGGGPGFAVGKIDPTGLSFFALVQALSSDTRANLLSTPSLVTVDNEEARIIVGQNVPFRTGSFTTDGNNSNNPFTTIQREDVGVELTVTPHVHDGEVVRLEVLQEVSNVVNSPVGSGAFADIVTNQRTIETTVLANNKQIIVLGGLIQDDQNDVERAVPILGELPVLGRFFSNTSKTRTKRNLLVFLRPTVLATKDEVAQSAQAKYQAIWDIGDKTNPEVLEDINRLFNGDKSAQPPTPDGR